MSASLRFKYATFLWCVAASIRCLLVILSPKSLELINLGVCRRLPGIAPAVGIVAQLKRDDTYVCASSAVCAYLSTSSRCRALGVSPFSASQASSKS